MYFFHSCFSVNCSQIYDSVVPIISNNNDDGYGDDNDKTDGDKTGNDDNQLY